MGRAGCCAEVPQASGAGQLQRNNPVPDRGKYRVRSVLDIQFGKHPFDVGLDCIFRNEQVGRDFLVGAAFRKLLEDIELAL